MNSHSLFSLLNNDEKLLITEKLNTRDAVALTATEVTTRRLYDHPRFWQQRANIDFHENIGAGEAARDLYFSHIDPKRLRKIVDFIAFTLAIDNSGCLHVMDISVDPKNRHAAKSLEMLKEFARDKYIIDILSSSGGTVYIRTKTGLYGFGSNVHSQLSMEKVTSYKDIHLVASSNHNRKILQVGCGVSYLMIRDKNQITIMGKFKGQESRRSTYRADNIIDVKCGDERAIGITRDNKLFLFDAHGQTELVQFKRNEIKDILAQGKQMVVWCTDGLYVDGDSPRGQLGLQQDKVNFTRLDFFDDKEIYNVHISDMHIVVQCRDGIYLAGMNNIGRLGVGDMADRVGFVRHEMDARLVTNIQLTSNTFFEVDGQWLMAGRIKYLYDDAREMPFFEAVRFSALNAELQNREEVGQVDEPPHRKCVIS